MPKAMGRAIEFAISRRGERIISFRIFFTISKFRKEEHLLVINKKSTLFHRSKKFSKGVNATLHRYILN